MKAQMDVDHGICREHYETFVQAMCGNPVDKLKVLFSIVLADTNYIQTTYQGADKAHWSRHPDVYEKSKVLADQLLSPEHTYYELQKTRHSYVYVLVSVQIRSGTHCLKEKVLPKLRNGQQ